jgi:hypothetical protein
LAFSATIAEERIPSGPLLTVTAATGGSEVAGGDTVARLGVDAVPTAWLGSADGSPAPQPASAHATATAPAMAPLTVRQPGPRRWSVWVTPAGHHDADEAPSRTRKQTQFEGRL